MTTRFKLNKAKCDELIARMNQIAMAERLSYSSPTAIKVEVPKLANTTVRQAQEIQPLSQEQLDVYHDGIIGYAQTIAGEVKTYNGQTKDMTRLVDLVHSFVQWTQQFPDNIEYPDTPDNARKVSEIQSSGASISRAVDNGVYIVLNNLDRDTMAFENTVRNLESARNNFENYPSPTNNLQKVIDAINDGQAKLDGLAQYVVVENQRSQALFNRINSALAHGRQFAFVDDTDKCRNEYIEVGCELTPARADFQIIGKPWNWGVYSVAIVSPAAQAAANRIIQQAGTQITSAYRNPKKEMSVGASKNSRHVYGDGVDFDTGRSKQRFIDIARAACQEGPTWVELAFMIPSYNHVHVDWRPGGVVRSSYCLTPTTPAALAAELNEADVRLVWKTARPSSEDGYIVERADASGAFAEIGRVSRMLPSNRVDYEYIDKAPLAGTHRYRVKAFNDVVGESPYTAEVLVTS
ncbi:MAG: hypothetical protein KC777_08550 [Cyanobacteria bacterium HKST-UBA02]|nr:hypothetical protein [Cyanobacteria bacterium HKST-UBA02]